MFLKSSSNLRKAEQWPSWGHYNLGATFSARHLKKYYKRGFMQERLEHTSIISAVLRFILAFSLQPINCNIKQNRRQMVVPNFTIIDRLPKQIVKLHKTLGISRQVLLLLAATNNVFGCYWNFLQYFYYYKIMMMKLMINPYLLTRWADAASMNWVTHRHS